MLSNKAKRELKINQRRILIDSIEIAIPSAQQILNWGERVLPNGKKVGEVKNSKTVNYKKFTPLRDGLFCERIFGPINSFVCACGKRQPSSDVTFCDKCEVEYIDKRVRRSRLGYISLVSPVVHVWYLKGRPSYLSLFLGKRKKQMLALAYCNAYLVEQAFSTIDQSKQISLMQKQGFCKQKFQELTALPFHNSQRGKQQTDPPQELESSEVVKSSGHHVQSLSKIRQLSNKFHKAKRITDNSIFYTASFSPEATPAEFALAKPDPTRGSLKEFAKAKQQDDQINDKAELYPATVLNILKSQNHLWEDKDAVISGNLQNIESLSAQKSSNQKTNITAESKDLNNINADGYNPSRFEQAKLPLTAQIRLKKWHQANLSNSSVNKDFTVLANNKSKFSSGEPTFSKASPSLFNADRRSITNFAGLSPRVLNSFFHVFADILKHNKNDLVLNSYAHTLPSLFRTKSKDRQFGNALQHNSLLDFYLRKSASCTPFFALPESQQTLSDNFLLVSKESDQTKFSFKEKQSFALRKIKTKKYETTTQKLKNISNFTKQKLIIKNKDKEESTLLKGMSLPISVSRTSLTKKSTFSTKKYSLNFSLPCYLWYRKRYFPESQEEIKANSESDFQYFLTPFSNQNVKDKISESKGATVMQSRITANKYQADLKDNKPVLNYLTKNFLDSDNLHSSKDTQSSSSLEDNFWRINSASKLAKDDTVTKEDKNERCVFLQAETPQKQIKQYNRAQSLPFLPSLICRYNVREELVTFFNSSPLEPDLPIPFYCEIPRWDALYDVHKFMAEQCVSSTNTDSSAAENKWLQIKSSALPIREARDQLNRAYFSKSRDLNSPDFYDLGSNAIRNKFPFGIGNPYDNLASSKVRNFRNGQWLQSFAVPFGKFTQSKINYKDLDNEKWKYSITKSLPVSTSIQTLKTNYFDYNTSTLSIISKLLQSSFKDVTGLQDFSSQISNFDEFSVSFSKTGKPPYEFKGFNRAKATTKNVFTLSKLLNLSCQLAWQKFNLSLINNFSNSHQQNGKAQTFVGSEDIPSLPNNALNLIYPPEGLTSLETPWKINNFGYPNSGNSAKSEQINSNYEESTNFTKGNKNKVNLNFSVLLANQVVNKMPDILTNKNIQNQVLKVFVSNFSQGNAKNDFEFSKETEISSKILTSLLIPSRFSNLPSTYSRLCYLIFTFEKRLLHNVYTPFLQKSIKKVSVESTIYQNYVSVNSHLGEQGFSDFEKIKQINDKAEFRDTLTFNKSTSKNYQKSSGYGFQQALFKERLLKTPLSLFLIPPRLQATTTSNPNNVVSLAVQKFNPIFENFCQQKIETFSTRSHTSLGKGGKQAKAQNSNLYMFIESRGLNFGFNNDKSSTGVNTDISLANKEKQKLLSLSSRIGLVNSSKLNFPFLRKTSLLTKNSLNISNVQIQPINPVSKLVDVTNENTNSKLSDFQLEYGSTLDLAKHNFASKRDFVSRNKISQFVLTRNILFATLVVNKTIGKTELCNESNTPFKDQTTPFNLEESESVEESRENVKKDMDMYNNLASNIDFEGYTLPSLLTENINGKPDLSLEKEFLLNKYLKYPNGLSPSEFNDQELNNWNSASDTAGTYINSNENIFSEENFLPGNTSEKGGKSDDLLSDYQSWSNYYKKLDSDQKIQIPKQNFFGSGYPLQGSDGQEFNASKQPPSGEMLSHLELNTIREILSYTGGGALETYLKRINVISFFNFLSADIATTRLTYKGKLAKIGYGNQVNRKQKRLLTRLARRIAINSRRLKIIQLFMKNKRRPECMMISVLPVLPPDLRPILQMSESVVVASDINNLYQRVIYRNNRFHKLGFIDSHLVTAIQRLVQDAVDRLIENGKGASKPFYTPAGRPLKSLSDTLKGKKGRFRYNLLGKRVDFSGRSVIVVSPQLKIQECGLPKEIALELYHYFLLRQILLKKQASSIVIAKKLIKERKPAIWNMLRDIIYHHPVLLNRAPTLHRLGIQAFQPRLIDGNAIWLHPLVCSAFNADFDGDQMGVHLPLSIQARAEAWDLLWSRNNLLSPATGQPVLVPSQDMVLGFYYMTQSFASPCLQLQQNNYKHSQSTTDDTKVKLLHSFKDGRSKRSLNVRQLSSSKQVFFDKLQLLNAFQSGQITIHTPVWLAIKCDEKFEHDKAALLPLELRINTFANSTYIYSEYKRRKDEKTSQLTSCIRTTAGRVLVNTFI